MGQAIKKNKVEYIDRVHGNSKGWITRSCIDENGYSQWHYKYLELKETDLTGENIYITLNTFYKPCRRLECIKELNFVYIDLDYYKTKYTKEQVIMNLESNYFNKIIPATNYIIDSGRGLALLWNINKVPSQALPLWKAIQEYLYHQLKEFGADANALDPTRVLRIAGTVNSKSNSYVEILDMHSYKYRLRDIQEEYLPEITEKKEKKKGRPKKIVSLYTEYSLYHARILDITKICELRDYDVKGHRELILFLYRYFTCCFIQDPEEALDKALELNSMFKEPLGEREVIRDTKSAQKAYVDKKYKYTNTKLIEILDITLEEQMHLKTIISGKEKYRRCADEKKAKQKAKRRNENGLTKKQQEMKDLKTEIKELKDKGNSVREIAKILGISKSKVGRLV